MDPQSQLINHPAGEVIFAEGSTGDLAYIVREGEVDIVKGMASQQVHLQTLGKGAMFGEMALITANARAATAIAKTDVTLEVVDRVAFGRLLQADSSFALHTMKRLAGMVPEAQARLISAFQAENQQTAAAEKKSRWSVFRELFRVHRDEVSDFAPDAAQIEQETIPAIIRVGGYAIAVFLVLCVLWASLAFTDTTVTGSGRVATTVPTVTVQPFDNGIVRQVNVREGELVKRGQVLATMDPTVSQSDLQATKSQLVSTEAQVKRLLAELGKRPGSEPFSPDSAEETLQRQLFVARQQHYQATLASHNDEIRVLTEQAAAKRDELKDATRQLNAVREIHQVREDFYRKEKDIFMRDGQHKLQYLEAQKALAQAEKDVRAIQNAIASLETQARVKKYQRDAFVSDWQAKANQELIMTQRDQVRLKEAFTKFDRANQLVELTAPTDAVVLSVKSRVAGTVLRSAEPVFELVPTDVPLQVEVDISPRDIAQVQQDDKVYIKVDSLPFVKHGMMYGKLRLISEATFDKGLNGQPGPVYRGFVSLDKVELINTPPNFRLIPGMTVTADIKVGSRKIITYFTYPLLRSGSTSLREP